MVTSPPQQKSRSKVQPPPKATAEARRGAARPAGKPLRKPKARPPAQAQRTPKAVSRPERSPFVPDDRPRCGWSYSGMSAGYVRYHDEEWGIPVHDDRRLFEFLILEGAQAGLSWSTILNKRAGYRESFADFDAQKVARFDAHRVDKLLQFPGIVRNRLKIESAITNARCFLEVQEKFGSFANYSWQFVGGKPRMNRWREIRQVPAATPESDAFSKDLRQRGFKFVGTTIVYAHMQATGMVNDHLVTCYRHRELTGEPK
jgi:DNA-3-methyladenine glycosylase I